MDFRITSLQEKNFLSCFACSCAERVGYNGKGKCLENTEVGRFFYCRGCAAGQFARESVVLRDSMLTS